MYFPTNKDCVLYLATELGFDRSYIGIERMVNDSKSQYFDGHTYHYLDTISVMFHVCGRRYSYFFETGKLNYMSDIPKIIDTVYQPVIVWDKKALKTPSYFYKYDYRGAL